MLFRFLRRPAGLPSPEPLHLAAEGIPVKAGLFAEILLRCPPLCQLHTGLCGILPSGIHHAVLPLPAADLPLDIALLLGGVVIGEGFAVIGHGLVFVLLQLFRGYEKSSL